MIFRTLAFVCFFALTGPVFAFDPDPTAQNVVAQWKKWMKKHGIASGSIIVAHNGNVVAEDGIKRSVDDPAKIASLSKSITAVCALRAADKTGKDQYLKLSEAIPAALGEHKPRDKAFANITIGQLITHTSGIQSVYHRKELAKLKSFKKENKLWQFSKIAKERLKESPGKASHFYSNANYLILGLAIEELTGEGYEAFCKREILYPLGIKSAQLNEDWRVMTSWGGWEISARDFLTFAEHSYKGENHHFRPGGFLLVSGDMGRGRAYGAGIIFRSDHRGANIWHQGSWRGVKGRKNDPFGAYMALYANGFSVVTNYAHDAWDRKISGELDSLLYKATHP